MQVNWNWLVLFSRDGRGFYDLNTRWRTPSILAQFDAEARATGTVHGHLNALPVTMTARVFYFNATTFAKAGLPVPSSWDELFAAGPDFPRAARRGLLPARRQFPGSARAVPQLGRAEDRHAARQRERAPPERERRRTQRRWPRSMQRLVDEHVIAPAPERASYGNVAEQELRPWITGNYAGLVLLDERGRQAGRNARARAEVRARAVPHAPGRARCRALLPARHDDRDELDDRASARSGDAHRLPLQRSLRRRSVRPAARPTGEQGGRGPARSSGAHALSAGTATSRSRSFHIAQARAGTSSTRACATASSTCSRARDLARSTPARQAAACTRTSTACSSA